MALEALGAEHAAVVWRRVLLEAAKGDMQAAGLVLARVYPVPRGRRVAFTLPPVRTPDDAVAAGADLLAAVAAGELSPEEGEALGRLVESQCTAIQTRDLTRRLEALESKTEGEAPG